MNIAAFCSNGNACVKCEHIKGIAYKYAALGVESALLPVICAILALLREYCAFFSVSDTSRRKHMPPGKANSDACFAASAA